jgi:Ca2+-binding EF-hand superfamily protein
MLKRLARSKEAKKAEKLSRKDVGVDDESFKRLDTNGDGSLDKEELALFGRCVPDVEIDIALETNGSVAVRPIKGKVEGVKTSKEKDGTVAVAIGNTYLVLGLESVANRGPRFITDNENFYKMQFTNADQDNNGYLDMNEGQRGIFAGNFKAMDADGDGKVYLKEVTAYLARQKELRDKVTNSSVTLSLGDQGKGVFDLFDGNGDGRLSVRELRQAAKLVERLDADSDGCISTPEIPRRFQLNARRGIAGGQTFGAAFVLSSAGRGPVIPPEVRVGPTWFRKMDRNRDGDVSRREFLGTEEQFRQIDTDRDGLIDAKEAEAFDVAQRRKQS